MLVYFSKEYPQSFASLFYTRTTRGACDKYQVYLLYYLWKLEKCENQKWKVPDFKTNICLGLFLEWEGLTVYCLFPEKFHKEGKNLQGLDFKNKCKHCLLSSNILPEKEGTNGKKFAKSNV